MPVGVVERGRTDASAPTIIFLHGWPDTDALFAKQYPAFEATHRLVSLVLPGYRKGEKMPFFGYDLVDDVVPMLIRAIDETMKGRTLDKPVIVGHDWGAFLATEIAVARPDIAEKYVIMEVGCHVGNLLVPPIVLIVAFQWALAFLFLLPRFIGTPISRLAAPLLGVPKQTRKDVHSGMNYPYLRLWTRLLTGRTTPASKGFCVPKQPVLYMYATKKPMQFHSTRFIKYLESTPGCGVKSYAAGHWFLTGRLADDVNADIKKFIG
jgi:pimeloyl-ACP methyl ester carboxylesterase